MTVEIKDRYTAMVLYSSKKAKDLREAVLEAIAAKADLRKQKAPRTCYSYCAMLAWTIGADTTTHWASIWG